MVTVTVTTATMTSARFPLATGITLVLDNTLLTPSYLAWCEKLLAEPREELWENRPWTDDNLVWVNGGVRYRAVAQLTSWTGTRSGSKLALDVPMGEAELVAYRDLIAEHVDEVDQLFGSQVDLTQYGESVKLSGCQVTDVPERMYYLVLDGCTITRLPSEVQILYLNAMFNLRHVEAKLLLATSNIRPNVEYHAPVVLSLPAIREGACKINADQLVVEEEDSGHTTVDVKLICWKEAGRNRFHVRDGTGYRALEADETLPPMRVLYLWPGLEGRWDPETAPETVIVPFRQWPCLVTGANPPGLEGYVCVENLHGHIPNVLVYQKSRAKRA